MQKFPQQIQDFANVFIQMQLKRHEADYNPECKLFKSAVLTDISIADAAITDFQAAPIMDRRAFSAWVMFRQRA